MPEPAYAARNRSLQHEFYLFALYRIFEAALLALVVFGPFGELSAPLHEPRLAQTITVAYLALSLVLLARARQSLPGPAMQTHVLVAVGIDIAVATLVTHAIPAASSGIALMLLFNIGSAGALFLHRAHALAVAAAASLGLTGEYVWNTIDAVETRNVAEILMFSVGYFAIATLTHQLGRQMRATMALADRRGAEAANLAEINELVIRRMRTGVLLVDGTGHIRLANEAALLLLRDDDERMPTGAHGRTLSQLAPGLALRLADWLKDGKASDTPLVHGPDKNEILPRFARLLADSDTTLIFLDDTSMLSRRAESLTLAAMGRFSASLAHEIRNPLAAISYATQLLEESNEISTGDRRLLQIIHQQCMRTNSIVESVLGLARRERAKPEHIDLVPFINGFIDDYRLVTTEENAQIRATGEATTLPAVFDPRHLLQIVTALVNNAVRYGRMPGEIARIGLHLECRDGSPVISILDRGPGIPDTVVSQLFRPFFTTSESGTGLGLYIANELCRANEATLEYVAVPAHGACFRITLPNQHALLSSLAD